MKLQLLAISLTNLPSWIWILKLNVDLDLGGKMNADPDPQPWDYHEIKEIQKICTLKTVLWIRFRMAIKEIQKVCTQKTVLWIRFRMDLELLSESGSRIIVPDPAKYERTDKLVCLQFPNMDPDPHGSGTRKIESWIRIWNKSLRDPQHCKKIPTSYWRKRPYPWDKFTVCAESRSFFSDNWKFLKIVLKK